MRIVAFLLTFCIPVAASAAPQDVAKKLFPKTVLLNIKANDGQPSALGSGFILRDGLVVSNFHVIEGAGSGFVNRVGDKTKWKIKGIVAKDEARDLVILDVEGLKEEGVTLSERDSIEVGETIFAVGNPRGLEGTFSQGIVSGHREYEGLRLLQVTAAISPGSSGGPIVDEKGEVVGVAVATFRGGQNLNFAVPIRYLKELITKVSKPEPLAKSSKSQSKKSLFDSVNGGRSTDGVSAGSFLWSGLSPGQTLGSVGEYTLSLKNNLDTSIRDPVILVVFYDRSGAVIDFAAVTYDGLIPPGLAKRVSGEVESSIKQLTTPISKSNQFMYADRPETRLEFRTLGFTLEDE